MEKLLISEAVNADPLNICSHSLTFHQCLCKLSQHQEKFSCCIGRIFGTLLIAAELVDIPLWAITISHFKTGYKVLSSGLRYLRKSPGNLMIFWA